MKKDTVLAAGVLATVAGITGALMSQDRPNTAQSSNPGLAERIKVQAYEAPWSNGFSISHYALSEGIPTDHAQVHLAELNQGNIESRYVTGLTSMVIGGGEYDAVTHPRAGRTHVVIDYNNDALIFGRPVSEYRPVDTTISNLGGWYSDLEK